MVKSKKDPQQPSKKSEPSVVSYTGSITTSGKSEAIRFQKSLFLQHPEFKQLAKVEAHVIGPGQMLVSVVDSFDQGDQEDPVVMAFLSFLVKDTNKNPQSITPLSEDLIDRALELTKDVVVSDDDVLAENVTF